MKTPLYLTMLLHFYCRRDAFQNLDAPAVSDTLWTLRTEGLIEGVGDGVTIEYWRTTSRGDAHVKQLLALPLPRQAWAAADGSVIDGDAP